MDWLKLTLLILFPLAFGLGSEAIIHRLGLRRRLEKEKDSQS